MEKIERSERRILTDSRLVTINKRETHYDSEEKIQPYAVEPTKSARFCPKISITDADAELPLLAQLRASIAEVEASDAKPAYLKKKMLIEMRKDQYIIKDSYRRPITFTKLTRGTPPPIQFEDTSYLLNNQLIVSGISLMNPKVNAAILRNYSSLKESTWDKLNADCRYLLEDFDRISSLALADKPIYQTILISKIDNLSNAETADLIRRDHDKVYTSEYISAIWTTKIPKLIADFAIKEFYILNYKKTKKCSRCGQIKPATLLFFSKNKKAKDQLYSICKDCRKEERKRQKEKKEMIKND